MLFFPNPEFPTVPVVWVWSPRRGSVDPHVQGDRSGVSRLRLLPAGGQHALYCRRQHPHHRHVLRMLWSTRRQSSHAHGGQYSVAGVELVR